MGGVLGAGLKGGAWGALFGAALAAIGLGIGKLFGKVFGRTPKAAPENIPEELGALEPEPPGNDPIKVRESHDVSDARAAHNDPEMENIERAYNNRPKTPEAAARKAAAESGAQASELGVDVTKTQDVVVGRIKCPNVTLQTEGEGVINISNIERGNLPKRSGGQLVAETIQKAKVGQVTQIKFTGIENAPTLDAYLRGDDPLTSVLGRTGQDAANRLGLKVTKAYFENAGGHIQLVLEVTAQK